MRRWLSRYAAWLLLVLIIVVCFAGAWGISLAIPRPARDEFNVVGWEIEHLPGKWLYLTARFFRGGLSGAEEDERLGRFLMLTARIREQASLEDELEQRAELEELRRVR